MATGDDALAAGMQIVPGTRLANQLDTADNETRDYIANGHVYWKPGLAPLPVAKGGIGGTTPAAGRSALQISAANTPNKSGGNVQTDLDYLGTSKASTAEVASKASQADLEYVRQGHMTSDVYNRVISGTRRAVWVQDNGDIGWASSKRAAKQDFAAPGWTPEQLLGVPILHYRYRAAVARERRGGGPAATEIGSIAEDLHALGLVEFVAYGSDGRPEGIHYELLGLAALWLAQRAYELAVDNAARLDALEQRSS